MSTTILFKLVIPQDLTEQSKDKLATLLIEHLNEINGSDRIEDVWDIVGEWGSLPRMTRLKFSTPE